MAPRPFMGILLKPLVVALLGLLVTLALVRWQDSQNQAVAERRFHNAVNRFGADLQARLRLYEHGMRGARGALIAAGEDRFNREVFTRYSDSRDVDREFPGARGFGFIRRVPAADRDRFVDAARRDGWPGFAITAIQPHAGEAFVIQYIEPVERNRQAVGLDIASEANRRRAALEAIRLGEATITEPVTLVQASGATLRAFLVLLPVYRHGMPTATPEQRLSATLGWTYAPLVLDEVLADLTRTQPDLHWRLADRGDDGRLQAILDTAGQPGATTRSTAIEVPVFNRTWQIQAAATPAFDAQFKPMEPATVGLAGLVVTALLTLAFALWQRSQRRTIDSLEARAHLATIIDNTDQAVIGEDTRGRVMLWNRAAAHLFGLEADAVMGQVLGEVLHRHGMSLRSDEAQQPPEDANELRLRSPAREARVLGVSRSPILAPDGRRLGQATLLQDITERQLMQEALGSSNLSLEAKVQERTDSLTRTERFLRTVLDSVPSMISYWDLRGMNRSANAAFLRWINLPREEVEGQFMHVLMPPSRVEGLDAGLATAWGGETCRVDFRARDGVSGAWREFSCTLVPDLQGNRIRGLYCIADDVTEARRSQQALELGLQMQRPENRTST